MYIRIGIYINEKWTPEKAKKNIVGVCIWIDMYVGDLMVGGGGGQGPRHEKPKLKG